VAIVITLAIGTQASLAASSSKKDRSDPRAVTSVEVTAADASSVTIEWPPSRFEWKVAGYGVYVDAAKVATVTPDRVHRWRDRDSISYTAQGLTCGRSYTIGVDVFDREDDRSDVTSTTVSTAACPDRTAPSTPTGVRQVATTESSVVLAWTPSSDDVGVVEYGLYDSGLRVASVSEASATVTSLSCGKTYLLGIDAADAAGNRSARVDSYFRTSACPSTNKPPSTPTGLKVTGATQTGVTLAWSPSVDDVSVAGYGLYLSGSKTSETTKTSGGFTSLECGKTYTLGVDAFDGAGKRSSVAQISAATSPCTTTPPPPSTTASVTQTIGNGSTLSGAVNWRAVYDGNGDKLPDDPGAVRFVVDGQPVLTEQAMPFGDTSGFWKSGSVANGPHSFQVLAVNDAGTVVASNTVTATVSNTTTTTPPPATTDTTAPTTPGNLRVVSNNGTGITIGWNAATDNVGVAGYDTYRGTSQMGQTQQTTATYSGLTCGTAYQLGVDAYDAAGNKSTRADLSATTAACADSTPPTAPANVTVSNRTTTSIALTWAPSTDNTAVAGYGIYNAGDLVNTTAGTTGIIGNLTCGTNYTLAVDAFDTAGNSSGKTTLMVSTLACADVTPPSQPTGLKTVSATTTGVTLGWTASTDNVGVTSYDVLKAGTKVGSSTTTSYQVTGLTCGTSYTLGVRALDSAGNMSPLSTMSASTSACASQVGCSATPHVPGGSDGMGGCWPGPQNTGPDAPESSMAAYTGPCNITVANTVIDSKVIRCDIDVNSSGLMIRNSYIYGQIDGSGFTVQDSIIDGIQSNGYACNDCGVRGSNFTLLRTEITHTNRGAWCFNTCTIQDTYTHANNLNPASGAHAGGFRVEQNTTLRHNTISCDYTGPYNVNSETGCSADITGYPDFAPIHNNTIVGNLLMANNVGIGFCAYGGGSATKPYSGDSTNATYIVFQNNVFQRGANGKCGAYGPVTDFKTGRTGNVWTNNTWDNGTVVNPG
jgi:chitodextrinase